MNNLLNYISTYIDRHLPVCAYDTGTFHNPKNAKASAIDLNAAIGSKVFNKYGFEIVLNLTFIIFANGIAQIALLTKLDRVTVSGYGYS